ncbi:hypothetical protein EYF80_066500 [Liparis tanakae]|uniref:Uncharacterized protein n=1 Tax=Liparis tanakae TaxID=230148 RepID=A0A4Z2E3S7_9TELE|nr:hypothetical protein EYF80_066500 [Liparis tanakae]
MNSKKSLSLEPKPRSNKTSRDESSIRTKVDEVQETPVPSIMSPPLWASRGVGASWGLNSLQKVLVSSQMDLENI